eukprot:CAMPEP_0196675628 /NCGR_PEP_ID=MMETSP1090-20130531/4214_1 /TAXON_ID=37098 /ORGANISM="Isochrysis sp, Strain CCMP1244" /LENGTH=141 /DNA_ID=CAMNT_0042013487 /DNA_START=97 /DNA_END=523 /DNA_ORIENTATION=+
MADARPHNAARAASPPPRAAAAAAHWTLATKIARYADLFVLVPCSCAAGGLEAAEKEQAEVPLELLVRALSRCDSPAPTSLASRPSRRCSSTPRSCWRASACEMRVRALPRTSGLETESVSGLVQRCARGMLASLLAAPIH